MPTPSSSVSVTAPLTPAMERVRIMLFQPFSLEKWFVVGFAAWLAQLGSSGGGGIGYHGGPNRGGFEFRQAFEQARDYVMNNLHWIIPAAIGIAVVVAAIWVLIEWLSSRGQFMFLHNVALDRAEIVEPWNQFSRLGNSLFLFRVALGLIGFAFMLPFLAWGFWRVDRFFGEGRDEFWPLLVWILPGLVGLIGVGAVAALVKKLTLDFVVPIMRLQAATCLEGWRLFYGLLVDRVFEFVLYLLFSLVLTIVIGILVVAVVLLTCCCAGCLMAIPYLGTVFLLPLLIFRRAYSLYYLAQFGPEFDVFARPLGSPFPLS